jgi:hypothetical protein
MFQTDNICPEEAQAGIKIGLINFKAVYLN